MGAVVLKTWGVILGVSCRRIIIVGDSVESTDSSRSSLYWNILNLLWHALWCAQGCTAIPIVFVGFILWCISLVISLRRHQLVRFMTITM